MKQWPKEAPDALSEDELNDIMEHDAFARAECRDAPDKIGEEQEGIMVGADGADRAIRPGDEPANSIGGTASTADLNGAKRQDTLDAANDARK